KTTALVSVNTSEIEKLTGTPGILSTADPLINVAATSAHHCTGRRVVQSSRVDSARTTHPAHTTVKTYGRAKTLTTCAIERRRVTSSGAVSRNASRSAAEFRVTASLSSSVSSHEHALCPGSQHDRRLFALASTQLVRSVPLTNLIARGPHLALQGAATSRPVA